MRLAVLATKIVKKSCQIEIHFTKRNGEYNHRYAMFFVVSKHIIIRLISSATEENSHEFAPSSLPSGSAEKVIQIAAQGARQCNRFSWGTCILCSDVVWVSTKRSLIRQKGHHFRKRVKITLPFETGAKRNVSFRSEVCRAHTWAQILWSAFSANGKMSRLPVSASLNAHETTLQIQESTYQCMNAVAYTARRPYSPQQYTKDQAAR